LVEIYFYAKIKKLKTDNGDEYITQVMTAALETKEIIHDISLPYADESKGLPEHINRNLVTMVRSMTSDYANVIPQAR
jgi:hypothetical protein